MRRSGHGAELPPPPVAAHCGWFVSRQRPGAAVVLSRRTRSPAAERGKAVAPDIAAPLIAAVVKTTGIVKLETIEPMIANKSAFHAALDELRILPVNPVAV